MQRYAVGIEYDGTQYSGWQRQSFLAHTIQEKVETAISRVANQKIEIIGAGRTDAGVHASGQVFHFDSDAPRSDYAWLAGSNRYLPPDIRLQWLKPVAGDFHARYSAIMREYSYWIQHGSQPSALWRLRSYWHPYPLDADAMREAAQILCGEHDFSAFRAAECQARTSWRFIESIKITDAQSWLVIKVRGNAFLHHMVRNIVGSLLPVGDNRRDGQWLEAVLTSKDRKQAGITAPAYGLYFERVDYPNKFDFTVIKSPRLTPFIIDTLPRLKS